MKLNDERFWKFEVLMLPCGIATACMEALNYGIALFHVIGQILIYPVCFLLGGFAAWRFCKSYGYWKLAGLLLFFSTITFMLFHTALYPVYGVAFDSLLYWETTFYWIWFAIFPVMLCCYIHRRIAGYRR